MESKGKVLKSGLSLTGNKTIRTGREKATDSTVKGGIFFFIRPGEIYSLTDLE
jgi:hypothetical protein